MSNLVDFVVPAALVAFVWWASTGAIFFLNGRGQQTYRWSLLSAACVAMIAGYALLATRMEPGAAEASIAFVAAIAVWGLIEMTFLMGFVTGPRRTPCPAECTGLARFGFACMAIAYHEVLLFATLALIGWHTAGTANFVGAGTFALLWLMRLLSKLNIFFGVPNTSAELLPRDIAYLASYFRRAPMTAFFPLSITIITLLAGLLFARAATAPASSFEMTAYALLTTLTVLGMIEHWFLVLPISPKALWGWSLSEAQLAPVHDPDAASQDRSVAKPISLGHAIHRRRAQR